ncbi:MAG: ATP-binding protein [Actinomycetota bacterium]
MLELRNHFRLEDISVARKISAAVVNVSGRQRMLCQRIAFFCLRLASSSKRTEREKYRVELLEAVQLMQKSHQGLIQGDPSMNLLSKPSATLQAMYFEPPLNLDKQVGDYLAEITALLQASDDELTPENPHLSSIMEAASGSLLASFDAVVTQYQQESEAEQLEIDLKLLELYQKSCDATTQAEAQTKELENAIAELKRTQAKLLHSEKMSSLGQLVASVAHEINNPVSFIYGNLSHAEVYVQDLIHLLNLYQEHYPEPVEAIQIKIQEMDLEFLIEDLPKVLASMQIGSDRIRQIVMSLRNYSRTDDTEMKPVDLHESIESTLLILQNRLKAQPDHPRIEVIKNYSELPLVECFVGQLNQVFMNILSNAIDALEEGRRSEQTNNGSGPTIFIYTQMIQSDSIVVRIADNGPGIKTEVKQRIFEQFFTTKQMGKGTGLGLSISYQIIVENHKGTLRCESQLGQGTEFWIELPVKQRQNPSAINHSSTVVN